MEIAWGQAPSESGKGIGKDWGSNRTPEERRPWSAVPDREGGRELLPDTCMGSCRKTRVMRQLESQEPEELAVSIRTRRTDRETPEKVGELDVEKLQPRRWGGDGGGIAGALEPPRPEFKFQLRYLPPCNSAASLP